jgi:predicted nucleotidyltransferase
VKTPSVDLPERKYLRGLLGAADGEEKTQAVVLVGSWARGTQADPTSDLDVLVIGDGEVPSPVGRIQVINRSADELRRLVATGDDFAQWALRFGRPLKGRQLWTALREELMAIAPWPRAEPKLRLANRRLRAAEDLLEMGDLDATEEEARYALSHLARALLLARGVFPLSRPELPVQLEDIGDTELARALRASLRDQQVDRQELEACLALLALRLRDPSHSEGASQA